MNENPRRRRRERPVLSTPIRTVAVVGASLAGLSAVEALRNLGYDGRIVVVGGEAEGRFKLARPLQLRLSAGVARSVARSTGTILVGTPDPVNPLFPPYQLHAKVSPTTGKQDDGEFLAVDMTKLPAATSTATVTISVR